MWDPCLRQRENTAETRMHELRCMQVPLRRSTACLRTGTSTQHRSYSVSPMIATTLREFQPRDTGASMKINKSVASCTAALAHWRSEGGQRKGRDVGKRNFLYTFSRKEHYYFVHKSMFRQKGVSNTDAFLKLHFMRFHTIISLVHKCRTQKKKNMKSVRGRWNTIG